MKSEASVSLGYVILFVPDVAASLAFYEKAFALKRRFFHDDAGKAYGELETGATRLSFVSLTLGRESVGGEVIAPTRTGPPLGAEIALTTPQVKEVYDRAVKAGATPLSEPKTKPWGQVVAYVRDNAGHLVEICSPLP